MLTSISFNLINRVKYQLCQSQKWQYHLCAHPSKQLPQFFSYFQDIFLNDFIKNPQTRNARAFLPLNISAVGSVNCHGCKTFFLAEIHCYLSPLKSWHNNSFLSSVKTLLLTWEYFLKIDLSSLIFLIEPHLVLKHVSYINTPKNQIY